MNLPRAPTRYSTSAVECGLKSSSYKVQSDSFSVIGKSSRLDIGVTYSTRPVRNDMAVIEDEHPATRPFGYEPTREAAMAAVAKSSWRGQLSTPEARPRFR